MTIEENAFDLDVIGAGRYWQYAGNLSTESEHKFETGMLFNVSQQQQQKSKPTIERKKN